MVLFTPSFVKGWRAARYSQAWRKTGSPACFDENQTNGFCLAMSMIKPSKAFPDARRACSGLERSAAHLQAKEMPGGKGDCVDVPRDFDGERQKMMRRLHKIRANFDNKR